MKTVIGRIISKRLFNNPILIVGAPRSGTTILLRALGQHSRIIFLDEAPFIPYIGALLHPFEFRENKEYHRRYLRTSLDDLYQQFRRLSFESALGRHYGLRTLLLESDKPISTILRARHWCVKTFPNEREGLGLVGLYPRIRFLYIYRDGCSVVNSMSYFGEMKKQSFLSHCKTWTRLVDKYKYLFDLEEALPIRQEDLLTEPVTVFKTIQTFIGLSCEEGPADFSKSTLVHPLDKPTQERVNAAAELQARPAPYAKWDSDQKQIFKAICGNGMRKLGYQVPF